MWIAIALVSGLASLAGYGLFQDASPDTVAFVLTFAAGAILTMLADTMMPEAFEHGGKLVGVRDDARLRGRVHDPPARLTTRKSIVRAGPCRLGALLIALMTSVAEKYQEQKGPEARPRASASGGASDATTGPPRTESLWQGRPRRTASVDGLDLARPPGLVEERRERAVEAQDHEPALALGRLDPVALGAVRRVAPGRSDRSSSRRRSRSPPVSGRTGCRPAGSAAASGASSGSRCRRG